MDISTRKFSPEESPPRLDERQERIHRRLLLIGPGPAAFFRDACVLMERHDLLTSSSHLVGHLLREVESAIRDVLKGIGESTGKLARPLKKHAYEIEVVLAALSIADSDPVAKAWLRLGDKADEYALHRRAHRDSLASPRPVSEEFRAFWEEMQMLLDVVMDRFEARYLAVMPALDDLLGKENPKRGDAKSLKNNVPNNIATLGHFFSKLDNPKWLEPLRQEGFFARPPEPEVNEEAQSVTFSPWPAIRFLKKMASLAPELVAEIAAEIPRTQNTTVHFDLLETALALPPRLAVKLVSQLKDGVECRFPGPLFRHYLDRLLLHLAGEPENSSAVLELARATFAVTSQPGPRVDTSSDSQQSPKRYSQIDVYEYERILAKTKKEITLCCKQPMFQAFCDLLEEAVTQELNWDDPDDREDWSYIWCRDVEHCSCDRDIRCALIAAVRDSATYLVQEKTSTIRDLVRDLQARRWKVLDRIALHLLRLHPDDALTAECLLQRDAFDDQTLRREYNGLLASSFGRLSKDDQATMLGWIEEGLDIKEYCDEDVCVSGQRPTDDETRDHAERMQLARLHPIRDSLPASWRSRYDSLIERFSVPQIYPPTPTFSWGRKSPLEADNVRSMSLPEVVEYLRIWSPGSDDHLRPSREGLADSLQRVVTDEPERFAIGAEEFGRLHPVYVCALLSGFQDAAKKNWQSAWWVPVLELCVVLLAQRGVGTEHGEEREEERSRRWLLQSIARLLGIGLDNRDSQLPIALREQVWSILLILSNDPDPAPDDESRDAEPNKDPVMGSMNTVRGEAMHAVIRYALWVRRQDDDKTGNKRASFEQMPEVRDVLNEHLDIGRDPSPAIRSIYGQYFPWLAWLDESWTASRADEIFPTDPAQVHYWEAAWAPYVVAFSGSCRSVFQLLSKQYERAVFDIEREIPLEIAGNADYREQLAEHLMILYGSGKISLDGSFDLLRTFFARAPLAVRHHALAFAGRSLKTENGEFPQAVLLRFKELWERRVDALKDSANHVERSELKTFGWWFIANKFSRSWALDRLQESLQLCGWTEPDHLVMEHLAAIVAEFPKKVVACLSVLIDGDKNGWGISVWSEHTTTILRIALDGDNEDTKSEARDLINRLCARGFHQYRDLLENR